MEDISETSGSQKSMVGYNIDIKYFTENLSFLRVFMLPDFKSGINFSGTLQIYVINKVEVHIIFAKFLYLVDFAAF